jgi:hypothetical protein
VHQERAGLIFHGRNRPIVLPSILAKDRSTSRTKQWRRALTQPRGAPWLPVKLIYTLEAKEGKTTPMRKLISVSDRDLSQMRVIFPP